MANQVTLQHPWSDSGEWKHWRSEVVSEGECLDCHAPAAITREYWEKGGKGGQQHSAKVRDCNCNPPIVINFPE